MLIIPPRLLRILTLAFAVHIAVGALVLIALIIAPPLSIGTGSVDEFARRLEQLDFRWFVVPVVFVAWVVPILATLAWRQASATGLELDRVRELLSGVLRDRAIPVTVDIHARMPVRFDEPLKVPVELHTHVTIDQEIEIEAEIPFRATVPIDAEVETTVLRFGTLKVPIRASIPIDVIVPFRAMVRIRAERIPVDIREEATIRMPPMELPIDARIESKLDLLANLKHGEELLRRAGIVRSEAPPAAVREA